MRLDFETIKAITCGAISVLEDADSIHFQRFTEEQFELYRNKATGLYEKSQASAGIKLSFKTDSERLFIKTRVENACCRSYFSFDVYVNECLIDTLDNFAGQELPQNYSEISFPVGEFSKIFDLGAGVKTVTVHLPWNKKTALLELSLDDGAWIEPAKPRKKLLAFGDSITQGFDSLRPSMRYISRLAKALDAEEFNKAIGAERYFPELAGTKESFVPDYITVAYGTNDWRSSGKEEFEIACKGFYAALERNYPGVTTFVITPIWRHNLDIETAFDSFSQIEQTIRKTVAGMKNVVVISGINLVPHDVSFFGDDGLHPNAEGFDHYFRNLYEIIKEYI